MVAGFGRTKPNCAVLSMAARSRQTREGKVKVAGLVLGPRLRLEAVMRRMLIVTAAGAAMLPRVSQAYERPWCALTDIGGGVMHENCTIPTFEMCVQEVIAGNRGFCIPNPRWQGPRSGGRETGARRKRVNY